MAQAPAKTDPKTAAAKGQKPPDERFWVRYSPHHEFPLSLVASVALHVGAIVLMVLAAIWFVASPDGPAAPPRMEVVEIMGGDPMLDGLGQGDTLKGSGDPTKQENVGEPSGDRPRPPRPKDTQIAALKDPLKGPELKFPGKGDEVSQDEGDDPFAGLDQATKQATEDIIKATQPTKPPPTTKGKGAKGGGKNVGSGGPKGKGGGGKGKGVGPGRGMSPYGQVLTDQRKRQMRWQILASTDGRIHLAKLKALRVTLVMPTRKPGEFTIFDLERNDRPQVTKRLEEQADKVWWTNRDPIEVQALARVLGLRETPQCFVIFLPKALEDRMVQLEEEYQGAREDLIEKTIWDVPQRDGRYASEPQVVQQILRRPR
jgi:hypothetical protein